MSTVAREGRKVLVGVQAAPPLMNHIFWASGVDLDQDVSLIGADAKGKVNRKLAPPTGRLLASSLPP